MRERNATTRGVGRLAGSKRVDLPDDVLHPWGLEWSMCQGEGR